MIYLICDNDKYEPMILGATRVKATADIAKNDGYTVREVEEDRGVVEKISRGLRHYQVGLDIRTGEKVWVKSEVCRSYLCNNSEYSTTEDSNTIFVAHCWALTIPGALYRAGEMRKEYFKREYKNL